VNGDDSGDSSRGGKSPGSEKWKAGRSQAAPGLVEASSRVWGKVSLQKQAAAAASNGSNDSTSRIRTFRNRFAPVAVRWAAALLQQCDVKQQGVDLFGRDSLLLGRLLTVLGTFVEAAAETPAAVPLCAGLLELLKAKEVSAHHEVCGCYQVR
jgi:telomere length regulation protein